MIRVSNLKFRYGGEPVFDGVSFFVNKGEKVGLVGQNGSGKSTLFRILAGIEAQDEGRIEMGGKIWLVPQEIRQDMLIDGAESISDYLDLEKQHPEFELKQMLAGMEMKRVKLTDLPINLSGGQKTKLAIIKALLAQPEILLLDEPTNFLDVNGKRWMFETLAKYPKTLLVVSHDLPLLNKTITKVLYINPQFRKIDEYVGNYDKFLKQKAEKEALIKRQIETEKKHIAQMKESLVKSAGVKSSKGVRQRMNVKRRLEKMEEMLPPMPAEAKKIKVVLPEPIWVGELPIFCENISKSFGENKVLSGVNLTIRRGERVVFLGPNGAGKSTLIKILLGVYEADSGRVVRDAKLKTGYYTQELENFDYGMKVLETVRIKTSKSEAMIRPILAKFLFPFDKLEQKVGTLSGGEKTRLSIACLLLSDFNLLVLDEPTTYLDVLSQRLILEGLKEYKGAMILVSHNPEFVDEIAPRQRLYLPENRIEVTTT
ncbi:MAG: ABC-F family ATP-binding cassette domain-containing protein [Candidatus Shapirobacteria bacterium]